MKAFSRPSSGPPQLMQRTFASTGAKASGAKASGAKASTFTSAYFAAQWGTGTDWGVIFLSWSGRLIVTGYLRDRLFARLLRHRWLVRLYEDEMIDDDLHIGMATDKCDALIEPPGNVQVER